MKMGPLEERLTATLKRRESEQPPSASEIEGCYTAWVADAVEHIDHARELGESTVYSALGHALDELNADLREAVQELTRKEMWGIIQKLRGDAPLTDEELKLVRLWVVGDADAYVREENNYGDWTAELDRLRGEIDRLREAHLDTDNLEALRALLTDARGVTRSIEVYLADRQRVERFEETMSEGLDREDRQMLADILSRSLNSPSL